MRPGEVTKYWEERTKWKLEDVPYVPSDRGVAFSSHT